MQTKSTTLTDKVIVIVLVIWLLFFGGFGTITKLLRPSTIDPIARTIGEGARRISDQAVSSAPAAPAATLPAGGTITKPRLSVAPARTTGAPPVATQPLAPTLQPTSGAAALATPTAAIAGGGPPAAPPAAPAYTVPAGQHTEINPDGSFTIDNGNFRYYPNAEGVIIEVRIVDRNYEPAIAQEGAPPEQHIFLNPEDAEDAAVLAEQPTAAPRSNTEGSSGRGRPKR